MLAGEGKITPHKGGRTIRIEVLVTPETKALLVEIQTRTGKNAGDLLAEWVREE